MSACRTIWSGRAVLGLLLSFLALCFGSAVAQQENPPKGEFFIGYQWLNPGGSIPVLGTSGGVVPAKLNSMPRGFGGDFLYNLHPNFGLELDYGFNRTRKVANINTVSIGPRFTYRGEGFNLFAHTLLGWNRLNLADRGGALSAGGYDSLGAILGGGLDLLLTRHLALRLAEADYQWTKVNFSDVVPPSNTDLRHASYQGARLRSGVVFNFGGAPPLPPTASCSLQPNQVMVGEPITATVSTTNFNPKHALTYNWTTTGGKVTGKDTTASVDTNGVAGGSYTVTARVSDPKMKKGGEATCNASFTVKEPPKNPPTMSCSANPSTVQAGTPSTITCTCTSPDNVAVTVASWTASAGSVSGEGSTATLNTAGASAGPITVSATCTDSRGLTASGSSQVTVEVPPPPPPQASKLSSCDFPNKVKPWRVDNTCKAVLDDVAQRLQHEPDARLVIVGNADPSEKRKNLAAERAVDSKAYLSGGEAKQAIDASRIEVRTGTAGTKTADYWVVPAGASFTEPDTTPVDESVVKPVPDHPRAAPKKKPAH